MRGKKTPSALVEQAKALYPLYDNYQEVANVLGLPRETVRDLINKDDEYAELRQQQKRLLIQKAHQKASETLEAINPDKVKSNTEAAIVFGTLVDKMAVLSGENSKWASQTFNIGDSRKIEIVISPEAKGLIGRRQKS